MSMLTAIQVALSAFENELGVQVPAGLTHQAVVIFSMFKLVGFSRRT